MSEESDFLVELAFKNIEYVVENKISNFSPNTKEYLEIAIDYFENVARALDSLSFSKSEPNHSYHFIPHLGEVAFPDHASSGKVSSEDKTRAKKFIRTIIEDLRLLRDNSATFYSRQDTNYISNIASVVADAHSGEPFSFESSPHDEELRLAFG